MAQVGAREIGATIATTGLVERTRIIGELGALDVELAAPGVNGAVARVARRNDAVEHVVAGAHRMDDVLRPPYAHQVTRPIGRQQTRRKTADGLQLRLALADAEPADGEAFEREPGHFLDAPSAQIREQAALDNTKE